MLQVTTDGTVEQAVQYNKVISTLFSKDLASIAGGRLPSLKRTHAVTIQVANLWYPQPNLHHPYHGFGYLIPQSVPAELNPEAGLGVLFDSDREAAALAAAGLNPDPSQPQGTKFTVMMGGHYFDGIPDELLPTDEEAADRAVSLVTRHLGISPTGVCASAFTARNCIPQHYVGHMARMAAADRELDAGFGGALAVVGGSYRAPGVLPSMRHARDVAMRTAGRTYWSPKGEGRAFVARTGIPLPGTVMVHPRAELPLRFGNGLIGYDELGGKR